MRLLAFSVARPLAKRPRVAAFPLAAVLLLAAATLSANAVCYADTLDQQTGGINPNAPGYFGQAFSVGGSGSYTNITFNFYSYPGTVAPYATGTGYLYNSEYRGTPAYLGSSPDLLASVQANGGLYNFGASLVLDSGRAYWFYENALIPENSISGQATSKEFYYAGSLTTNFTGYVNRSNNYLVTGTSTSTVTPPTTPATPEPSSLALLGTGFLTLVGAARKRLR